MLQGWHLSDSQNQKRCCSYTPKVLHRRFYMQKPLHRVAFRQSSFYTDAFAHRRFCRQELLHRKAFSQRSFYERSLDTEQLYTQMPFHKEAFTHTDALSHGSFYVERERPLHRAACTHRCPSYPKLLHVGAFAHTRAHTHALTQRSF